MQYGAQHGWGEAQFQREAEFAVQALRGNDHSMKVAMANPVSLRDAIIQAAIAGTSFNPALGHAYLVPYGDRICYAPSYRGLRDAAIEDGLIVWARSEIVHKADSVSVRELDDGQRVITHEFAPFADRGPILGAYCAWLDGNDRRDLVFETIDEIYKSHRSRSKAYPNGGIWKTDEPEAIRKALMKRAQKSWPRRTDRRASRFDSALAAEFENEDSIETTSTEVRRTPESARIARPSETPHQGKAGNLKPEPAPLELTPTDEGTGPRADAGAADVAQLWKEIDDFAATLAGGDLGKASEITRNVQAGLKQDPNKELADAQVLELHAALKAAAESDGGC